MAAKAAGKPKRSRKKADDRPVGDRLVDAALTLAETRRWRDIGLHEIAAAAEVDIGVAIRTLPSRLHILQALADRVDTAVFDGLAEDPLDGTIKDNLFDLLMRRFDALEGRQSAMKAIAADLPADPLAGACLGARFLKSMAMTLEAAGVSAAGCTGMIRTKGLGAVQLNAFRAWVDDEDPGLSATMAALDKGLRQADRFAGALSFGKSSPEKAE